MNIGELKEKTVGNTKILVGTISTLSVSLNIELSPTPKTENPNAPNYTIYAWSDSGVRVQVGAAWVKTMKRGPNAGEDFLTMTIDDPSMNRPLNVAAFRNPETNKWDITFRRRQEKASA